MNDSAYWDLYQKGTTALRGAQLAEAEKTLTKALAEARRLPSRILADRARCNLAATQILLDTKDPIEADLSRILGTSGDLKTRQLAAYTLATFHNSANRIRIARFYAQMSLDMARQLRDVFSQRAAAFLLGLIDHEEGRPYQSRDRLREALDVGFGENAPAELALVLSTLGYTLIQTGDRNGAIQALEESEKSSVGATAPQQGRGGLSLYEPTFRLNLGFSYLEIGELDQALQNARKAFDLRSPDPLHHKHALYLLGESHAQRGEIREAREHFLLLQQTYYPKLPDLTSLLLSVRTHSFLSWLRT